MSKIILMSYSSCAACVALLASAADAPQSVSMTNIGHLVVGSTLDSGEWWCDLGWKWTTDEIPVYIHGQLHQHLHHQDGSEWRQDELRWEIEFVLERLMDQAASNLPPLFFAGFEADGTNWNDPAPSTHSIAIRPNLGGTEQAPDCKSGYMSGSPGGSNGVRIFMGSTARCSSSWDHWALRTTGGPGPRTFGGTLMHELMHAIGFHHWGECQATPPDCVDNPGQPQICGNMQNHGLSSEGYELEFSDTNAIREKYGEWDTHSVLRFTSTDALSWTSMSRLAIPAGPYLASSYSGEGRLTGIPLIGLNQAMRPNLWLLQAGSPAPPVNWGECDDVAEQLGPIGAAATPGAEAGVSELTRYTCFYMSKQFETFTMKFPFFSYHDGKNDSTYVPVGWPASRHGRGGSYDPRSGKLIHVSRDQNDEILLSLSDPTGYPGLPSTPAALTSVNELAAYTPAVACGPDSIKFNCIMVWASAGAEPGGRYHLMKWTQFRVVESSGGFEFDFPNKVYTNGYVQFGPPSVVYKGPALGSSAFVVAWRNPGKSFFTLRKPADPSAPFTDERQHSAPGRTGPPALGAADGIVEVYATYQLSRD